MSISYQTVDISKCVWFLAHWISVWDGQSIMTVCSAKATCLLKTQRDSVSMKARRQTDRQTDQLTCQDPLFRTANTIPLCYPTHNNRDGATTALSLKVLWLLCPLKHKHQLPEETEICFLCLYNFLEDPKAHFETLFVLRVALMEFNDVLVYCMVLTSKTLVF